MAPHHTPRASETRTRMTDTCSGWAADSCLGKDPVNAQSNPWKSADRWVEMPETCLEKADSMVSSPFDRVQADPEGPHPRLKPVL